MAASAARAAMLCLALLVAPAHAGKSTFKFYDEKRHGIARRGRCCHYACSRSASYRESLDGRTEDRRWRSRVTGAPLSRHHGADLSKLEGGQGWGHLDGRVLRALVRLDEGGAGITTRPTLFYML